MTKQTGRGSEAESPETISDYFTNCFYEYFQKLGVEKNDIHSFLLGKEVMEYGPGDVPGVALMMYAHGAKHVSCVDRFPLVNLSDNNVEVINCMLSRLSGVVRARAIESLVDAEDVKLGFRSECIEYLVKPNGLSNYTEKVDLIVSRAVLEHVNNLPGTFNDMSAALTREGQAIHQVDLKSHGLHMKNKLDFLVWPTWLWNMMYSNKGVPNRWRINKYLEIINTTKLVISLVEPTSLADEQDVKDIFPHLHKQYGTVRQEQLSWLGFWLVLSRKQEKLQNNETA
ncbi:MAG: methyltransferase domain-containing protein [Thiohalomonadales bacterium]